MAPRGIGLPALLCLAVIAYCSGCAPLESGTPLKIGSPETDFVRFHSMKLRGVVKDHEGTPLTGVASVLFAIYEQPEGGAPSWLEVQNVELDGLGRFTTVIGSTRSEGIPAYLFAAQRTLWLGEQVMLPGEVEQPRIQLVSTSQGLVFERAGSQAIPGEPREQPTPAGAQPAPGQTADSQESGPMPDQTEGTDTPLVFRPRFGRNATP